ncbi:hypothetical protein QA862_22925 [Streptomyces sp. B21-101]
MPEQVEVIGFDNVEVLIPSLSAIDPDYGMWRGERSTCWPGGSSRPSPGLTTRSSSASPPR